MNMPVVQIRQQFARIGMETTPGQWDIKQPRAGFQIQNKPAVLDTKYIPGEQSIDQSPAWEALGKGSFAQFTARVAQESKRMALEGIGRRADEGNRLWAIHQHNPNVISDIAYENFHKQYEMEYEGPYSSMNNVKLDYTPRRPEVNFTPGELNIEAKANYPQINYTRGQLNIYLLQKNSLEIIPPQIDMRF